MKTKRIEGFEHSVFIIYSIFGQRSSNKRNQVVGYKPSTKEGMASPTVGWQSECNETKARAAPRRPSMECCSPASVPSLHSYCIILQSQYSTITV